MIDINKINVGSLLEFNAFDFDRYYLVVDENEVCQQGLIKSKKIKLLRLDEASTAIKNFYIYDNFVHWNIL